MDLVNYPLLDYIGKQNLPVILSTGMATLGEVEAGLIGLLETGCSEIILLHCVTGYPVRHEDANLRVIETLSNAFQRPVGFSDHTLGIITPIAAFVLGAVAVEKHFTLNTQMPGPDHAVSLDPVGFKAMVEGIRVAENALGNPVKKPLPVEIENRRTMRRSITTLIDLPAGTELKQEHLVLKRPGGSLGAEFMNLLVGRRLGKTIPKDTQLTLEDVIGADVK
jgi:N-acetylneuraminate synthase/N,N'-diacetyllegionaminate synthase